MFKKLASIYSKIKGFPKKFREVIIRVPEDHFLVALTAILEWEELIRIAKNRRAQVLKMLQVGRRPHLREMWVFSSYEQSNPAHFKKRWI